MSPRSSDRPLVFAHRGSSEAAPEHTLPAYLRAIEEGADGLECDVRLTRDGHLVLVHDRRLERTSNGRGRVSIRTLAELDELDFGSWHPGLPDSADELIMERVRADEDTPARTRVLTLERLLAAVHAAGRPMKLLIETKHPTRYGGDVELRLVEELRKHGLLDTGGPHMIDVTVMSFSLLALRRLRDLAPDLTTVLLLDRLPFGLRDGRLPFGTPIGGPGLALVKAFPRLVERLHDRGNKVYVWTVNEPDEVELMLDLKVDGIITDRPHFVVNRLAGG